MDFFDWYFKQIVTQAQMDWAFERVETAMHSLSLDDKMLGIVKGMSVVQHAPLPDKTVDLGGPGVARDPEGQRIAIEDALTVVDCSQDEFGTDSNPSPGEQRYISVFVRFKRNLTEQALDGNNVPIWTKQLESFEVFVRMGSSAAVPVPAPLMADAVLVCDILVAAGFTAILNGDIDLSRREDWVRFSGTVLGDRYYGTPSEAVDDILALIESWGGALPFVFTQPWFGAVPVGGPTPPPTTMQEALNAIVYDLAGAGPPAGDALISSTDFVGVNFSWAAVAVSGALSAIAGALDSHISGGLPQHPASAVVFTPYSFLTSVDVQAAIQEMVDDLAVNGVAASGSSRVGWFDNIAVGLLNGVIGDTTVQGAIKALAEALQKTTATTGAGRIGCAGYSWLASTNLQSLFQEIVDDLASQVLGATGASRVGIDAIAGTPETLAAGTLRAAISSIMGHINARGRLGSDEVCYGDWWFTGENTFKTLEGGGAAAAMTPSAISAKNFWGAADSAWASPLHAINTCDLSAYLGAVGVYDVCVGHYYGGATRPVKPYIYALTNGVGAAPQCSVLVIDPDTMTRVATWSLTGLGFVGHAAGDFAPVSFCTDGSKLYILFKDGTSGDFVGCISAIDGTIGWAAAVFNLGGFRLSGSYPEDRIIIANSNTDLVILCGGIAAGATGILYSCDKNGVARWGGVGADGDAILGQGDSGLCSDGTNVYFATYHAAGGPDTYLNSALISTGADPGLATPYNIGVDCHVMDLVFDGRMVRWGTTDNSVSGATISHYDTEADAGASEFRLALSAGPPAFNPTFGSACHDGEHLCILESDIAGTNPFERMRVVHGADYGDPWKAGGVAMAEPRGQVHMLNPVGSAPGTDFFGVGRVCWDGRSVYAVVNSGAAVLDMIRKIPRVNYRG
jgi:hypothetical protein